MGRGCLLLPFDVELVAWGSSRAGAGWAGCSGLFLPGRQGAEEK